MTRIALLAAALTIAAATPAPADEVEAALEAALEAWRAGDARLAADELDYASTLMSQAKVAGLGGFLPAAFDGWTREDETSQAAGVPFFGGGGVANATYRREGGGETVSIEVTADSPMIAAMAAMFANPTMMAMQGEVRRAGRQRYVVSSDGDLTAMVDNRIMVQASGSASIEDKIAYFEAIDFAGLAAY
ncbi:MAG: hypothetical protein EA355_01900 [Rhodobacteraceae bacterium]|nr:MAG: hypothetical protein EA355_01900 [Paracoccaceae bacterium]